RAFTRDAHAGAGADGPVWVGTWGGGLNRFRDGRFVSYTTRDGLFCDTICQILEDGRGRLWMSSVKGIFRVSKEDLEAFARGVIASFTSISYGRADGMASSQRHRGSRPSGGRMRDGRPCLPRIDGLVMVGPEHLPTNDRPPTVIIEEAQIDGRPVDPIGSLHLPPSRGELAFRYTATSLVLPEKVRFRYR